jgi:C-terminal processing protease CtpA/Prc
MTLIPPRRPARSSIPNPRSSAAALGAATALLLAGCSPFPTRPGTGPIADLPAQVAAVSAASLSSAYASEGARRDVAERVWRLVAERYYDPKLNGIDWPAVRARYLPRIGAARSDADFYRELKAMVAELRDSHTQVLTRKETVDRRRFVMPRLGAVLNVIDGRVAVTEVEPASSAAHAGIAVGDVLVALGGTRIDAEFMRTALDDASTLRAEANDGPAAGLPADARDAERVRVLRAVRRLAKRAAGGAPDVYAPVRLTLERADGRHVEMQLAPARVPQPPTAELRELDDGIVAIRLSGFRAELRPQLARALAAAAPARGVIVDLRGNGGGLLDEYRWFAGHFVADERVALRSLQRDRAASGAQAVREIRVEPQARMPLLQPLVVLVDQRTGSAAELAAVTLAEQRGAVLIGEPTCGCVVGVNDEYVLPDGGGLRIAEIGFVSARGARMEGEPTLPAVRVVPTLADLRAGRDPVLEEAQRRLRGRVEDRSILNR